MLHYIYKRMEGKIKMKKLLLIFIVIALLPVVSYASTEDEPVWTEGLYDETNFLSYWHYDNLELRLPSYYTASVKDGDFVFGTGIKKDDELIAYYVYLQHLKNNSKSDKILRQYEKKNGINQTLIYFLKGQHSSGQVDETLIHRLSGTPEGTVVYWTPQVIKSSSKESYESQAAIWSDDNYQIITSVASSRELSIEGLFSCLKRLYYRGKRLYYDNLKDGIQYSNGLESDIHITNPLRKAVSSSITIVDHIEGSTLTDWQECDIPEYKVRFYCPSGVFMLSQDSADQEWTNVIDISEYEKQVAEARDMMEFITSEQNKELVEYYQLNNSTQIYWSTAMETKRSYEDGSCLDISPNTVVYIAPEYSKGWHLTIDIYEERDYPKGANATSDNLNKWLADEVKEADCYNWFNYDACITTIGSQLFAHTYNTSPDANHYVYLTYHDGRKMEITLSITQPEYAEYMDLLPFMEDLLKHMEFYD